MIMMIVVGIEVGKTSCEKESKGQNVTKATEREFQNKGIYFAHFSKTGGTTFKLVLKQYLQTLNKTWCENKLTEADPTLPKAGQMCGAHAWQDQQLPRELEENDSILQLPYSSVLMVRDPIERLLSEYAWFYIYQGHRGAPQGLTHPFFSFHTADAAAKLKILQETETNLIDQVTKGSSSTLCVFLGRSRHSPDQGPCTQAEYERAVLRLQRYDLVLINEQFDSSLVLFAYWFNLPGLPSILNRSGPFHYIKHKVISNKISVADLTPSTVQSLRALLHFDYLLYALASDRFLSDLSLISTLHSPSFSLVLDSFLSHQLTFAHLCEDDSTAHFKTCLDSH